MLGDCFHSGDKYTKADTAPADRVRSKSITHIRLHGYMTTAMTRIPHDGELVQGWFARLKTMYKASSSTTVSDDESSSDS